MGQQNHDSKAYIDHGDGKSLSKNSWMPSQGVILPEAFMKYISSTDAADTAYNSPTLSKIDVIKDTKSSIERPENIGSRSLPSLINHQCRNELQPDRTLSTEDLYSKRGSLIKVEPQHVLNCNSMELGAINRLANAAENDNMV